MKQSGHESDCQKIDDLSAQNQTMQNILQELVWEKQGMKGCCISQEKKSGSNFFNNHKGVENKEAANKRAPDASKGIKSALGQASVVGGEANVGELIGVSEKESPA